MVAVTIRLPPRPGRGTCFGTTVQRYPLITILPGRSGANPILWSADVKPGRLSGMLAERNKPKAATPVQLVIPELDPRLLEEAQQDLPPAVEYQEYESTLEPKQRLFVELYLQCWNATEAAKKAGYSPKCAYQQGYYLMTKPEVRRIIKLRLTEVAMTTNEVLARLTFIAKGSLGDFLVIEDDGRARIDWDKARARGVLGLLKKFTVGKRGLEVELLDQMKAIELLGKYNGVFPDRLSVKTENPDEQAVVIYIPDNKRNDGYTPDQTST